MNNGRWPGTWKFICDVCGFEYSSDKARHRWDGLIVCPQDFEHRHEQDFLRVKAEKITPPWTRPEAPDTFVPVCTPEGMSAYPGMAMAGCMISGFTHILAEFD